jgi:general stress protein 26
MAKCLPAYFSPARREDCAVTIDQTEHIWDIAERVGTCMLTTHAGDRLRSRPMHAVINRETDCLWFITDHRGAKEEEIKDSPEVCLTFADIGSNTYLSLTGRAEIMLDSTKASELWSDEAQAWWPKGPTDPDVRVLRVVPDSAEYWDARGNSLTVAMKLAVARMSGKPPDLGDNGTVRMRADRTEVGSKSNASLRRR